MSMGNARSKSAGTGVRSSSSETTGWDLLAVVLDHMRDRLQAGARTELLELAQVAFVKGFTARVLWENGFKSVQSLAETDAKDLVPVLMLVSIHLILENIFFATLPRQANSDAGPAKKQITQSCD